MFEEFDARDEGVLSPPLQDYLVCGTPLHPDDVIALGHEPEKLAHRLDFAYRDLAVKSLPNSLEVEARITRMKRFAARALILQETGPKSPEYILPFEKTKKPRRQSRQQG